MPVPTIHVTRPRPIDGHDRRAERRCVASVPTRAPAIAVTAMATTSAKASTRRDRSTRKLGQALQHQRAGHRLRGVDGGQRPGRLRPDAAAAEHAAEEQRRPGPDAEQRQRGQADAGHRPQPRHVRLGSDEEGADPRRRGGDERQATCSSRYQPMVRSRAAFIAPRAPACGWCRPPRRLRRRRRWGG